MVEIGLGLGANLGERTQTIQRAIDDIVRRGCIFQVSIASMYQNDAHVLPGQFNIPPFINTVVVGQTLLSPARLLSELREVEQMLGRLHSAERWAPRVIDLDLLYYGELVSSAPELELPHPRLGERDFVLRPLYELRPAWTHPATGQCLDELLGKLRP